MPAFVGAMIDEDGVLLKPVRVQPPPPPPPAPPRTVPTPPPSQQPPPPPPLVAAAAGQADVLVPAGVRFLSRPGITYIPATPVQPAAPPAAATAAGGGGDDWAQALALADANTPDLTGLPDWTLADPFGARTLAAVNPPLKGGSALEAIVRACVDYGVDSRACVANALLEGASGRVGDNGKAYGPFQVHATDGRLPQFAGRPASSPLVNAWAWSDNGVRYAVRSMAAGRPSARGLHGHAAVAAIIKGFERPTDIHGAYVARAAEYDHLVALGAGWAVYAASRLAGPVAGGATDSGFSSVPPVSVARAAGVNASWRTLMRTLGSDLPLLGSFARNTGARLPGSVR